MGRNREQQRPQPSFPVDREAVRVIITEDDPERLVQVAEDLGKYLADIGLTTSQIRNIFGTARRLQADWLRPRYEESELEESELIVEKRHAARRQLVLLKPKLAYQAQRMPPVKPLADWLVEGINWVIENDDPKEQYFRFTRFMDFFEAVLAYHTAKGGKQEQRSSRG
jgi:CRISPR-associated protein Csm2